MYNRFICNAKEDWRLKYYEPVIFKDRSMLEGFDADGNLLVIILPEWRPKYKAMAERKIHLNQMRLRYRELFELDDPLNVQK